MILVDTSVWINQINSVQTIHTQWLRQRLINMSDDVGLTDRILSEVLQGMRTDQQYASVKKSLLALAIFDTGGSELALAAADNFRFLRKRGITIRSAVDALIATFSIEKGHTLLHNDRDFDPFEKHLGLKVIHPEAI
jgi:predicted nucleic acid-binding protein